MLRANQVNISLDRKYNKTMTFFTNSKELRNLQQVYPPNIS